MRLLRKLVSFCLLMLLSVIVFAQQSDSISYCEILGRKRFDWAKPDVIYFDFGYKVDGRPKDAKGKPIDFENMVDALNYMVKEGWEFVTAYADVTYNHFLLRRRKSNLGNREQEKNK